MAVPELGSGLWSLDHMQPAQEPVVAPAPQERKLITSAVLPAIVVLLLFSVYFLDQVFQLELFRFGILPRSISGLGGILASPFIHGDFDHVLNNAIPLFVLGWALMYFFPQIAGKVVVGSWLVSGFWVWVSARDSFHIGASGVVYGLAAFLFTSGLLRKQRTLMGLSLLVVFLYGSLLWGMFPLFPKVSWESHFWGAAAGVAMAYLYRTVPSAVRDPREIVWPEEEEEDGPNAMVGDTQPTDEAGEQGTGPWRTSHTWQRYQEGGLPPEAGEK